jgi:diaminohydroxyphosphoribosylaminopyrimidine deaminase/5-amino-6-(5-phosphoribosylamino)uracil reductase
LIADPATCYDRAMNADEKFMRRALELAERGRGFAEPNPLVGAVIVRASEVVGEGYHERFGQAHAEINALARAGSAAHGTTLYVNLEPCCHHGKTPPCTDAIIAARVQRVVVGMTDPFEQVAGDGLRRLVEAGVTVETGVLEQDARRLNAPYLKLLSTGMPYVHAKWAMTLDGRIATASGDSKWITGPEARRVAHELRGRMDAIIVGIQTALTDDPLLTARPPGPRVALRVVVDSTARLPTTSHLARTARDMPVLVATTDRAPAAAVETLRSMGCECLVLPATNGAVSVEALLRELGGRRHTNVLVEGGSRVLGSLLDAGQINEVHVFVAGKLLGGEHARSAVAGVGLPRVADALRLESLEVCQLGDGVLIHGPVRQSR